MTPSKEASAPPFIVSNGNSSLTIWLSRKRQNWIHKPNLKSLSGQKGHNPRKICRSLMPQLEAVRSLSSWVRIKASHASEKRSSPVIIITSRILESGFIQRAPVSQGMEVRQVPMAVRRANRTLESEMPAMSLLRGYIPLPWNPHFSKVHHPNQTVNNSTIMMAQLKLMLFRRLRTSSQSKTLPQWSPQDSWETLL